MDLELLQVRLTTLERENRTFRILVSVILLVGCAVMWLGVTEVEVDAIGHVLASGRM